MRNGHTWLVLIALVVLSQSHQALLARQQQGSTVSPSANLPSPCPTWSSKFDEIDDAEMVAALDQQRNSGWDAVIQAGVQQGSSLRDQITAGEQQLEAMRAALQRDQQTWIEIGVPPKPSVTAARCKQLPPGSSAAMAAVCDEHLQNNGILGMEGTLELLRCRAGIASPKSSERDGAKEVTPDGVDDFLRRFFGKESKPAAKPDAPSSDDTAKHNPPTIKHGGLDVQACLARKEALTVKYDQLNEKRKACERVELKKQTSRLGTDQPYCFSYITGRGLTVPAQCGEVEYECYACKDMTIEAVCAGRELNKLECVHTPGVH